MTSPLLNPTPLLRYSYAEGTIPDFSIDFSADLSSSEVLTIHVGQQDYVIPTEEIDEYQNDPRAGSLLLCYIYADATRVLTSSEGFAVFSIGPDHKMTFSDERGISGNISCSNGTITITFQHPTVSTISFDTPEWCYYPDENGEYGLYNFIDMDESTLYASSIPICPGAAHVDFATSTAYLFYNDGYIMLMDPTASFPEPPVLDQIVENNIVTDIHWDADGAEYPAGVFILPLEVTPSPAESPMWEIPVTYDSASRRISLPRDTDPYGGATTDVNSVKLSFSGIEPFGNDFIARVDFAVPIKKDDYTIEHPFILLEQNGDAWSAVIPNAVLMAAKDTKKLPFQLILANDSQVINSRNAITLNITPGIDSLIPGSDLPEYEAPEWPLPEEITYTEEDVHTVEVTYDPTTRTLSTSSRDMYGGATIDTRSVRINVSGIVPTGNDFSARLDFAAPIRYDEGTVIKPFVVLEQINNTWCAIIPQAILMAAKETKKLPFQLVTRHGDTIINSRNAIVLEITRAINAMESVESAYAPYIMYRNDTWEWVEDFTYDTGAVVVYNGEMYTSLSDDNLGYQPDENPEKWSLLTGIESVILGGIEGTKDGSSITFTSAQVFTATGFTASPQRTMIGKERPTAYVTYQSNDNNSLGGE